ncbi:(2Fe-2S)-binding protein [Fodinicurvata fenggangensis]|uniref:(2Fe-2S)-binding protein n=1 Tax=Fodinicurvata fenggangensis TaxID=1121830 RepID=UPI0009DF7B83|nr:(2Fe-2S)-binding protein [Fodinicurvata fenggangensis]
MYVCLCNGFTCRDVRRSIEEGAGTVAQVYRAQGAKPNCGRCRETISDILTEERTSSDSLPLASSTLPIAAE